MTRQPGRGRAGPGETLGQPEAELAAAREQIARLHQELEEANRGLIAMHAELEDARQAAARLAAIVQSSADAMFSLTPDGVIQSWNPGAERLFGYPAGEIVGRSARELVRERRSGDFDGALVRLRAGARAAEFDSRGQRRDGSLVDVAVALSALREAGGTLTGLAAVVRDVTERLRAEAELVSARAQREVLAERDRMARDLHDSAIQRLFAAGMALQGAAALAGRGEMSARIDVVISELDTSIEEIREAIFTLRRGPRQPASVRAQVLALAAESERPLGFSPSVSFEGPIDTVPEGIAAQLVPVLREALSNVARHAGAAAVEVTLSAGDGLLLRVSDNGCGVPAVARPSGLRNMRERAQLLGGSFEVTGEPGGGTTIMWQVPLPR
ncbi:MAG TPA: PAS domain-containing sensor histidine kinase [Streptosporangiaceae bacterium]|nr:PAS domain-containing sensor histidine kinase [Streptosporangiaceae bacterium]